MINNNQSRNIPEIKIEAGVLTIRINAQELKKIAEGNSENNYYVLDENMFLNHFAANLEEYQTSNSVEKGMTALQEFFDIVIDETYTNGSEAIIDKNDNMNYTK